MKANAARELGEVERARLNSGPVAALLEASVRAVVESSNGKLARTAMLPLRCAGHVSGAACYFSRHPVNGWEFEVVGHTPFVPEADVYSYQTHYVKCEECGREYRAAREPLVKAAVLELGRQSRKPSSDVGVSLVAVTNNKRVR